QLSCLLINQQLVSRQMRYTALLLLSCLVSLCSPFTISTEQGASLSTSSATEPRKSRLTPLRPWLPITIKSAAHDLASSMISHLIMPETTSHFTSLLGSPCCSRVFASS